MRIEVSRTVNIAIKNVSKFFVACGHANQVLKDVSLLVHKGEFISILGPSGCGKSTLLSMVAGLETCEQGQIEVDESHLNQPERHRMMMFQEAALFPWYSVIENVMYGLRFKKNLNKKECRDVALYYLDMVGLKAYADARVYQLSGGMKQRVALARALAPNPQMLLMDEPFSALDTLTCERIYDDFQRIWLKSKKTVLLVTHNVREAVTLSQKVIVFSPSPGHILKEVDVHLPFPRYVHDPKVSALSNEIVSIFRQESVLL